MTNEELLKALDKLENLIIEAMVSLAEAKNNVHYISYVFARKENKDD
jgi:hypothetical protein